MQPNPFPSKPLTVIDDDKALFPSRQYRINVPLYAKAAEEFIKQVMTEEHGTLARYHLCERWKFILTALMFFDIQLVQGPRMEKCVLYFLKRRGKLYTSVPVRVALVSALDMNTVRVIDPLFRTLIAGRFYQLRDWHGFTKPFNEFLWQSSRTVALQEAIALVEASYVE